MIFSPLRGLGALLAVTAWLVCCSTFEATGEPATPADGSAAQDDAGDREDSAACGNVDLGTDKQNCGRCGRDCGRGMCVDGACEPYKVKCELEAPFYLAVDDQHVYWTTRTNPARAFPVRRLLKDDPNALVEGIGPSNDGLFALALTTTDVFLTSAQGSMNGLFVFPKSGGPESMIASGNALDLDIAFGATPPQVFFANNGLRVFSTDGGTRTLRDGPPSTEGIAVDDTFVYWTINDSSAGQVGRRNLDGGTDEILIATVDSPRRLSLDDEALYVVTSSDDGSVSGQPRRGKLLRHVSGGTSELITDAGTGRGGVAVDDRWAYVTYEEDGMVVRVDKRNGTGFRVVASKLNLPTGIVADATSIWFAERGAGCLWRMTR